MIRHPCTMCSIFDSVNSVSIFILSFASLTFSMTNQKIRLHFVQKEEINVWMYMSQVLKLKNRKFQKYLVAIFQDL